MKLRFTMVAVLVLFGIGLWVRGGASAAVAAADGAQPTDSASDYKYVGTKKCKSCHLETHKSWGKTKMGTAFETLKPGTRNDGSSRSTGWR